MPVSRWQGRLLPTAGLSCDLPSSSDSPELRRKPRKIGGAQQYPYLTPSAQKGRAWPCPGKSPKSFLDPQAQDAELNSFVRKGQELHAKTKTPVLTGPPVPGRKQPLLPVTSTRVSAEGSLIRPAPNSPRKYCEAPTRHTLVFIPHPAPTIS